MARKKAVAAEVPVQEETKPVVEEKKTTDADEIAELKNQIAALQEMLKQAQSTPVAPVIQVATPETERIHFIFEAELADDNVFLIGDNGMYGRITGKTGSFYIPKDDLSRINDGTV